MAQNVPCPYSAWKLYLPTEEYNPLSPMENKIRSATAFLLRSGIAADREEMYDKKFFLIDVRLLWQDEMLKLRENPRLTTWPDLQSDLCSTAAVVFGIFGLAKHQLVMDELKAERNSADDGSPPALEVKFPAVRARIVNLEAEPLYLTSLKDLRTICYGKLVSLRGTVVRATSVRQVCTWLAFSCNQCLCVLSVHQPYGKYQVPRKCDGPACSKSIFTPLHSHRQHQTVTVDWQGLKLQEMVDHDDGGGRVPRTVECEVTEDLCDTAHPGDVVTISGVVNEFCLREQGINSFQLYIHVLSLVNRNQQTGGTTGGSSGSRDHTANKGMEFNTADFAVIQEIWSFESLIFKLLVHSVCPTIYGHEMVKAGLLLGLFGGTTKDTADRSHIPVRSDPHILVVGDPGLGKSQMLGACATLAPRGVMVTGNSTTSSGLTVTVSKESGNEVALEAGALVMADQGCCCIDEFDKMGSQHTALLEAMEQQAVSIAKSGIVCTLPARTAVLAAANPTGGHYNKDKTVSQNLRLSPALLSRFDLVFILIDRPNEELDAQLTDHVLNLHRKEAVLLQRAVDTSFKSQQSMQHEVSSSVGDELPALAERLRRSGTERIDCVPTKFMRTYIGYARRYVFPRLDARAKNVLQNFYIKLRQRQQKNDSTPITTRQLEALVRLTEARAKLELREVATQEDAQDVIEIMASSMVDTFSDVSAIGSCGVAGKLDGSRSAGVCMSSRKASKLFLKALKQRAKAMNRSKFAVHEMKEVMAGCGANVENFGDFLSYLNVHGIMIKKGPKIFELLEVD